jgi:hypothetical protein
MQRALKCLEMATLFVHKLRLQALMRSRAACLKSKSFNFRPFSSTYIDNPSRAGKSRSTREERLAIR